MLSWSYYVVFESKESNAVVMGCNAVEDPELYGTGELSTITAYNAVVECNAGMGSNAVMEYDVVVVGSNAVVECNAGMGFNAVMECNAVMGFNAVMESWSAMLSWSPMLS